MAPNERLAALSAAGVSIWLDDLSRERLTSGNLQELITDYAVSGVTTNPTIFAAAVANGKSYDAQVRELAGRGADVGDAGEIVSIEHFGASADYKTLFREFGFTTEAVVAAARRSLATVSANA